MKEPIVLSVFPFIIKVLPFEYSVCSSMMVPNFSKLFFLALDLLLWMTCRKFSYSFFLGGASGILAICCFGLLLPELRDTEGEL